VLGLDVAKPRFSWKLWHAGRAQEQTSYRLVVLHRNKTHWDSGTVASAQSTLVPYAGPALLPFGSYSWAVQWADSTGTSSNFSAPQRFDMAPTAAVWNSSSSWVGGANQIRTEFTLPAQRPIVSATLFIAGLGVAKASINGAAVADHSLGPWTEFTSRVLYTSHDVTSLVKPGGNALGVMVGLGQYGYIGRWCDGASPADCLAARWLLHVRFSEAADSSLAITRSGTNNDNMGGKTSTGAQSSETVVGSRAAACQVRDGPVREDGYYYGEIYDARREQAGWDTAGFHGLASSRTLQRGWFDAEEMTPAVGVMSSALIPPIRKTEQFSPVSINVLMKPSDSGKFPKDGHPEPMGIAIFDFGQNVAGYCVLRLPKGACGKGAILRLRYSETTFPGYTTIYNQFQHCGKDGAQCALQEDTYICSGGNGEEVFEPSFTYHGFRYVELTGWGSDFTKEMLTSYLVHTDVREISTIRFDSLPAAGVQHHGAPPKRNILNDIQHITLYSQKSNLHSIPTDCPTREKRGWMGDAWVSSQGAHLTLDMPAFYTKWIRDIYDEQELGPCVASNIVPRYHGRGGCGAPPWAIAAIVVPYNLYRYQADVRIVETYYAGMRVFMDWLQSTAGANGLVTQDGLADWCPPETNKNNVPAQVSSFSQIMGWQMLAEMADVVGRHTEATGIRANLTVLGATYAQAYYNKDNATYHDDVQTANAMPLFLGIVPRAEAPRVTQSLVADIENRGMHLSTGIIGSRVLLQALTANNATDTAYAVATQDTYPSWGHFVRQNATTLWERWEASTHDPTGGSSMNHVMYGGQQGWFYTDLAGLTLAPGLAGAGYKQLRIIPKVPSQLGSVELWLSTPRGTLAIQWTQTPTSNQSAVHDHPPRFALNAEIPVGSAAEICMPTLDVPVSLVRVTDTNINMTSTVWAPRSGFVNGTEGVRSASYNRSIAAVCVRVSAGHYALALTVS
jgi:alpha-L-rhamnosidase